MEILMYGFILILLILVGWIFFPMIFGPFAIKAAQWTSINFKLTLVEENEMDHNSMIYIVAMRPAFENLGFTFLGYGVLSDFNPHTTAHFGLFRHEKERTLGMASVIIATQGKQIQYLEFSTKYQDDFAVDINNSNIAGVFINPKKVTFRFPEIGDVSRLWAIHRWILSKEYNTRGERFFCDSGMELDIMRQSIIEELNMQVDYGILSFDHPAQRFVPTWYGAVVMTFKLVFPFMNIRNALERRRARKLISGFPGSSNPE